MLWIFANYSLQSLWVCLWSFDSPPPHSNGSRKLARNLCPFSVSVTVLKANCLFLSSGKLLLK
jgi:hypothetical protein